MWVWVIKAAQTLLSVGALLLWSPLALAETDSFSSKLRYPAQLIISCRIVLKADTSQSSVAYDPETHSVCFQGSIRTLSGQRAIELFNTQPVETLVISSSGGSVLYALDMAEIMLEKKIDIVVNHICFSSCANYLFLAANHKYVTENSVVGWHGGPPKNLKTARKEILNARKERLLNDPQFTFKSNMKQRMAGYRKLLRRQKNLLHKVGVSDDLLYVTSNDVQQKFLQENAHYFTGNFGFTPDQYTLETIYGVQGIVDMWHPGDQENLESYVAERREEAKSDPENFEWNVFLFTFPKGSWDR